jgi:multiple sugar transport system ATP-binding protein
MRIEIARLHQSLRSTMIYVTHDQVEAMTLADRVVVMNGGIIEQVGPPQELYHNPRTRFVAGFIGSPAMNFIPGRLENGAGALRVTQLQKPGGKRLPAREFLQGLAIQPGQRFASRA